MKRMDWVLDRLGVYTEDDVIREFSGMNVEEVEDFLNGVYTTDDNRELASEIVTVCYYPDSIR
jgi:hypothetical protein